MKRILLSLFILMTLSCHSGIKSPFDPMGVLTPSQIFDGVLKTSGAGWVVSSIPFRPGNLSISLWFKAKLIENYRVLIFTGETGGNTGQGMFFYESAPYLTGNVGAYEWSPYGFTSSTSFEVDIWYHVVLTHTEYDADRMYVGGTYNAQSFGAEGTSGATDVFYFASLIAAGAWPFVGYLDDICIWDRAITAEEVATIFADNRATSPAVLVPGSVVDVYRFNNPTTIVGDNGGTATPNGDAQIVKFSDAN